MSDQSRGGLASMNAWWAASGLLILLVVVGVVVVIFGGRDPEPSTAAPAPPVTTAAPAQPSPTDPEAGETPLMQAPDTEWDLLYDIAVPTSPTDGPALQDGRIWSGWERSPDGALMAASYLAVMVGAPEAAAVIERQAVPGTQAQAYLNQLSVAPPSEPTPGLTPTIAGFRFVDYSDDAARVELLLVASDFAASIPVDVAWHDGDWKIDLEASGGAPRVTRLDGTSGFIPWSAA